VRSRARTAGGGAFSRAARDPLRPARVFWPLFAAGAAVLLVAGVVAALTVPSAGPTVVARGTQGSLVLPADAGGQLSLYAVDAAGQRPPDRLGCALGTTGGARARNNTVPGTVTVDGGQLHLVGHVSAGWAAGDTVRCPGAADLVATSGGGQGQRVALAGLLLATALVAGALALLGRAAARRHRDAAPPRRVGA
jgi:hypothetical protein